MPSTAPSAAAAEFAVAPYLDVVSGTADVAAIHAATGLSDFTLAFLLADKAGTCTPTWGGTKALTDSAVQAEIAKITALGGQAVISTGGATGTYLEQSCDATELATAYGKALDLAGSNHLDVDIEQDVDVTTVISALTSLQQSRDAEITFTVPVGTAGLTDGGVSLLRAAAAANLQVNVNAMVMNFAAGGDWGTAMVTATEAVRGDLAAVWTGLNAAQIYGMLGVTPMIGVNDTGAVTTIDDARTLAGYARENGLGFLRFWSVNRDNGDCAAGTLSGTCSGISQDEYAFTSLFTG
ncbi:glycosyl hydrolase [Actinoplanes sp. NPDC020271]|uniref:glycosyl hydrolase n=1 Tax=Actinoplanes sp. NPDC020271 TaxID=3363896 RepID=UPI0037B4A5CC